MGREETDFLSCIFGALKSGRGYVPIDRTVPADRAAQIAEDIKPQVVVDFGGFTAETAGEILTTQDLNKIFSGGRAGFPLLLDLWKHPGLYPLYLGQHRQAQRGAHYRQ